MKNLILVLGSLMAFTSCHLINNSNEDQSLSPIQAIALTAESAPESVQGFFKLTVKSGESKQRLSFLNSEVDNKDQRNLIIAIRPRAVAELTQLYGDDPQHYLVGKTIQVNGKAQRMKIWITYKNKNIKEYYYQTQIFVKSADQLTVL